MTSPRVDQTLVSLAAPESFAAEQYQWLRLKLERLRNGGDGQVLAVTSPGAGDGKTVTSLNLAGALARGSGARVLLVDADLRRPGIAKHLGVAEGSTPGLADIIDATADLAAATTRPGHVNFAVIPAGTPAGPVPELFRSPRFDQLLNTARQSYDYIVLDTPPLVPVFDAALVARSVDGVLVVVSADKTPRRLLEEGLNLLDQSKVLGIVFNGEQSSISGRYGRSYRSYFAR
jgi:succinoglycan biosynthesis transport protein ExoP